jgi:O-antigen/teichoic acid export membrane protein
VVLSKLLGVGRLRAYYRRNGLSGMMRALIRGVTAAMSGVLISSALSAVAQILIARRLGALLYGEYATLAATLGIIASLIGIGLDTWILAEGSRNPSGLTRAVWHVLLLKVVGAVLVLALLGLAWQSHVVSTITFVVGVVGVILDSFAQTGYSALRAVKRNGQVAFFQSLTPLLLLGALWATEGASLTVLLLLVIQAAASGVITLGMLARIWQMYGSPAGHSFDLRYVVGGAWLFVAADVLASVYTQSGVVMLGNMVGPAEVAALRPALTIITYSFMVSGLLFSVGLPMLNTPGLTQQGFTGLVRTMSAAAALFGLLVMGGLWIFGEALLDRMYGAEFAAALPLLRVVAVIPLIKAGTFVCAAILVARGRMAQRVVFQLLVALFGLAAGWLLIPQFGAAGAAWLYVAIEALLFALYLAAAILAARRAPQ